MPVAEVDQRRQGTRTVLVVDDHRAFAELLSEALGFSGLTPVGVASSAAQAVAMATELQPDIVVMDIERPQQDGLRATRRIREVCPDAVVAVVTAISRADRRGTPPRAHNAPTTTVVDGGSGSAARPTRAISQAGRTRCASALLCRYSSPAARRGACVRTRRCSERMRGTREGRRLLA